MRSLLGRTRAINVASTPHMYLLKEERRRMGRHPPNVSGRKDMERGQLCFLLNF